MSTVKELERREYLLSEEYKRIKEVCKDMEERASKMPICKERDQLLIDAHRMRRKAFEDWIKANDDYFEAIKSKDT